MTLMKFLLLIIACEGHTNRVTRIPHGSVRAVNLLWLCESEESCLRWGLTFQYPLNAPSDPYLQIVNLSVHITFSSVDKKQAQKCSEWIACNLENTEHTHKKKIIYKSFKVMISEYSFALACLEGQFLSSLSTYTVGV